MASTRKGEMQAPDFGLEWLTRMARYSLQQEVAARFALSLIFLT
jgi:hypothetical protein